MPVCDRLLSAEPENKSYETILKLKYIAYIKYSIQKG
jgi:hypothetical protein